MTPEPLGATAIGRGRCRFVVWAPEMHAVAVHLLGDDRWVRLGHDADGCHRGEIDGVHEGDRYRYVLDDGRELPDPASRWQPEGVHGPSAVDDPASHAWTDARWGGHSLDELVLYELHVGTFTPEGTFDGAVDRLGDLADLGVTAVELMPVAAFPGERNWGYDGVFPYSVQDSYGGPLGLRRLVDACHRAGLSVVLDVVYNHLGPEGSVLDAYAPYFDAERRTPWGEAIAFDGPFGERVREYFVGTALMWCEEFHVDGLRLDAIQSIVDTSAVPFPQELSQRVDELSARLGRPLHLIAETDPAESHVVEPRERDGFGLHAQWANDVYYALHGVLTGERDRYASADATLDDLATALGQGWTRDARGPRRVTPPREPRGERFVAFIQNHDQIGNRSRGDRLAERVDLESLKLAAATLHLSPFLPLLFMGEEYAETAPFPYFVSHGDPGLSRRVRDGRRRELAAFGLAADVREPQAEETYLAARLDARLREKDPHRQVRSLHKELLSLRRRVPALRRLRPRESRALVDEGARVILVHRPSPEGDAMLALAFGDRPGEVGRAFPGTWRLVLHTADARFGGPGAPPAETVRIGPGSALSVTPRSAALYVEEPGT